MIHIDSNEASSPNSQSSAEQASPKMNPALKAKWVEALRSGQYRQTTGSLFVPNDEAFCCLGVLCKVAGATFEDAEDYDGNSYELVPVLNEDIISSGEDQELSVSFLRKVGIPDQAELIRMNDGHGEDPARPGFLRSHTFSEIADFIEANL